jgi:hypothetical protein
MAYYRSIIDQLLFCAVISLQPYTLSLFPRANTVDASSRARAPETRGSLSRRARRLLRHQPSTWLA